MIRIFTVGVRAGLVVAALAAAVPMMASAQTAEPVTESASAPAMPTAANTSPTGDINGRSVQANAPAKPTIPTSGEVAIQRRFNELRRELLNDRADTIEWWLVTITIVIGFLALVFVVLGYLGFKRFREIEKEARDSVEAVTRLSEDAKGHVAEIESNEARSAEILRDMNARIAADDPEEARQAVQTIRQNPTASPLDKAIARALSLQEEGRRKEASEKWRAVAHVAEESNRNLAAIAWFSVGYLVQDKDPETGIAAYRPMTKRSA